MTRLLRSGWPVLLVAAALASLYWSALAAGFFNDDYLFLEQAGRRALLQSLGSADPLGGFFRPVSRQLYFAVLAPVAGGRPLVFHLANFAVFLAAVALVADLLAAFLPRPGVLAGSLYFAILPLQRVNLTWVSCSQDLLALMFSLGAIALFRRRRELGAALAYLVAILSKESALPLPLVLLVWARWIEPAPPDGPSRPLRMRLLPFAAAVAAWAGIHWELHDRAPLWATLSFQPADFAAGYLHGAQSLLGLDDPQAFFARLMHPGAPPLALLLLVPVALALRGPAAAPGRSVAAALGFAAAWLIGFGSALGPVAASWSSYQYTLFAVGGALLVGLACARLGPTGWLLLAAGLCWWHGAAVASRRFATTEGQWTTTSHLTPYYFERAAALSDTLSRQLVALDPKPEPGTRMFFSTLPAWAGFQSGNGARVRSLYRDPSLGAYFYSEFSESTAGDHSCRFFSWDGRALSPLYADARDRFFQVGSDLLVLGQLEGARHAFRRGLAAGETPVDHFYWLGWTELWLLRREAAERAWTAFGAKDDSVEWVWQMRKARQALNDDRDTLAARRALAAAIRSGIGHPEAHAVLGHLLLTTRPKYGLLELQVAVFLKPNDWLARRELMLGLFDAGLEAPARRQLGRLVETWPAWRADSTVVRVARTLGGPPRPAPEAGHD